jgi:molybdenum cofactor cytidylyltransferase
MFFFAHSSIVLEQASWYTIFSESGIGSSVEFVLLPKQKEYGMSLETIAPVILAAGDSTRMGHPKALLPLGPDLFINRILKTIRDVGLPTATVMLGNAAPIIKPHVFMDAQPNILINPDPSRGQLSSIQLGLSSLASEMNAALIWPVDIPYVTAGLVRRLVDLFINSGAVIALPVYGEKRGHPAIFHRSLFKEFMEAPLAKGPKEILVRHRPDTATLQVQELFSVKDVDTPLEYQELTGESLDSALKRFRFR